MPQRGIIKAYSKSRETSRKGRTSRRNGGIIKQERTGKERMEIDRVKVGKRRKEEDGASEDRGGPCGWMQGRTIAWAGSAGVPFPHIPHLYGNGGTRPPTTLL